MIELASPGWLALLALVALRLLLVWRDLREGAGAFTFSSVEAPAVQPGISSARLATSAVPILLEMLGWTLLAIALARPQRVVSVASDDRAGIDIVIALDASGSMAAEDFRPRNRFEVAKELIGGFIDGREDDRIGIVTFGSRAATRVPVTHDREAAQAILRRSEIGQNGDGTAIGQALATAVNRLRNSKARSRVIVLLTDGINNAGSVEPETAAGLAAQSGIKVYTVGVGSRGVVPMPVKVQSRFTGEIETIYQYVRADLDEELLGAIARATGGAYFRAVDPKTLDGVFAEIDRLEKSKLPSPKSRRVEELYVHPLAIGLVALCLALLGGETLWMRLPA